MLCLHGLLVVVAGVAGVGAALLGVYAASAPQAAGVHAVAGQLPTLAAGRHAPIASHGGGRARLELNGPILFSKRLGKSS